MVWKLHGCVKCGGDVVYERVTNMVECLQCGLSMTPVQYRKKYEEKKANDRKPATNHEAQG